MSIGFSMRISSNAKGVETSSVLVMVDSRIVAKRVRLGMYGPRDDASETIAAFIVIFASSTT